MQVGLVTLDLKPGGGQRLVLEEARHFQQQGHTVTLITGSDDEDFRNSIGIRDLRIMEYPTVGLSSVPLINRPFEIRRLRQMFVDNDLDFVISHYHDIDVYLATLGTSIKYSCHVNGSPFWFIDSGAIIPRRRKVNYQEFIDTIEGHGEFIATEEYSTVKRLYNEVREPIREKALQECAVVTTLTDQVASELEFCYEIDPAVIRPGVGQEWFEMEVNATARDINGVTTEHAILNVGRLDERKRNELLIRAFAGIAYRRDDVTLIIGGTGDESDKLRNLAAELGISERVVFVGYIPEVELPRYYAAADILAHPAWVAYGLVPLEAYVMGTKIAISTDTMVQEIIGGEPGVDIIAPEVSQWEYRLDELLDSRGHNPNKSAIPTWEDYFEEKYEVLLEHGFF